MLGIGKLGKGQELYYLEKVAEGAEDYYSGEGEAEGQWLGDAAAELGLSGTVEADQLTAMLTGRNPATGEPLGLRAVAGNGPVPGFDLTFSAPKSVSLLWALGDEQTATKVLEAHNRAVGAALHYMQREACWTRRGAGGSRFVQGNGFLTAAYLHRSSRNGDFQLHTHALIANATKGPDGRWTRLYHPGIYDHAKTAGYLYEAHLRHELSLSPGVRWQEVRNGIAEIEGLKDEWLREFSTRRAEILETAGAGASARARQVAALATRRGKEQDVGTETMRERWLGRAEEIGIDGDALAAVVGREVEPVGRIAVEQLDRKVTAHAAHFDRRDAVQAVAELLPAGAPAREVEAVADAFLGSETVIEVSRSAKGPRFTTERIWELERGALERVEGMKAEPRGEAGEPAAARVIASRPTLKDDQREMVRRLLCGREGVAVVIGEAGTGKSFAVVAAAEGWAEAGYSLRAAAPTWRAANVLRAEGLEATSVARLLIDLERGEVELSHRSVLLVDEAAMVGSEDMAALISRADEAGAKLVLIGDPEQLGAIEAGGLFAAIAERTDPVVLDEVIRHNHALDRDAAKRIREGEGREALSLYRSAERVVVAPDAAGRREAMVADWWSSFSRGEDALVVSQRNVEVERLNAAARELLRSEGRLGAEEIEVGEARFAAGDQVITRVNDHAARLYNRERWRVVEVDVERGGVVLEGIDSPRRVEVGPDYLARTTLGGDVPALQHAYAVTTYCAQGTTVDRAYVMADPSMDKQEFYVATSRSRDETWLYATPEIQVERSEFAPAPFERDAISHVAEAAERDRAQTAAHDEALRELPTPALEAKVSALAGEAAAEHGAERRFEELQAQAERTRGIYEKARAEREALEGAGRRERKERLPEACRLEDLHRDIAKEAHRAAEKIEPPGREARRAHTAARKTLADRERSELLATRLRPPAWVVKELGERPADPAKAKAWDRGVSAIQTWRREHGVTDTASALGRHPESLAGRRAYENAQRRLREARRRLGRERHSAQAQRQSRSIGMGIQR